MKTLDELLTDKEREIGRIQKEIKCLRAVAQLAEQEKVRNGSCDDDSVDLPSDWSAVFSQGEA